MAMRAASAGLSAFLRFSSTSERCMASAARTARSASFSCATGYPNSAISPSPSFLPTFPPLSVTAAEAASR